MTRTLLLLLLAVLPWWAGRPGAGTRGGGRRLPWRRRGAGDEVTLDPAVLLDLVDVALAAGASVPDALRALGAALGAGPAAHALGSASRALRMGAPWSAAWTASPATLRVLADALEPAWGDGVDPGPLVRRAAAGVRARRQRAAREAAERLGARLVLPLGLCFLPAFVLLAVVPVLLSGGGSLLGW